MSVGVKRVADAYLQACRLELEALKPGNVSVHAGGHGMTAEDFILSARYSVGPLADFSQGLGRRIYTGVERTREAVGCNTNLGVILLAAPLMEAAVGKKDRPLRERLRHVLDATTVADAAWCFQAICLAAPAGLGRSDRHDVDTTPQVTLLEAMREAAGRDQIAHQYVTGYSDIFEFALPLITSGADTDVRIMTEDVYLAILAHRPDTHIRRKYGERTAEDIRRYAGSLRERLKCCATLRQRNSLLRRADRRLKRAGINPGTSADLTVSVLLVWQLVKQQIFPVTVGDRARSQTTRSAHFHQPKEKNYGYR